MGSLRIANAPTIGDLGTRLAKRRFRDALTGHTFVQAYNCLQYFGGKDGVKNLLPDLDSVYSDESQQLGLEPDKISRRIIEVEQMLRSYKCRNSNDHWKENEELTDNQEFEFFLVESTPDLKSIKEFLGKLDTNGMNITNVPLMRCMSDRNIEQTSKRLNLSTEEKKKLRKYLEIREQIIKENSCPVTDKNKAVLGNDIKEISRLIDWTPINLIINGLDDPEEVQDELETAYMSLYTGEMDFLRIESSGDNIGISYYIKMFIT